MCGRANQRSQLCEEQFGGRQTKAQPPESLPATALLLGNPATAEERLGGADCELILVDVEGANSDRRRSHSFDPAASCSILLVLRWKIAASRQQKFVTIE